MKPKAAQSSILACIIALVFCACLFKTTLHAEDAAPAASSTSDPAATEPSEADKAWKAVYKACQSPMPPPEWSTNKPSNEQIVEYFTPKLVTGANLAKDFYTKFPAHTNAYRAQGLELKLLTILEKQFGDTNYTARVEQLSEVVASNPNATKSDKIRVRISAVQRLMEKLPGTLDELEKSGRAMLKDYPGEDIGYQILLVVLRNSSGDKAQALAHELTAANVPEQVRDQAEASLKTLDLMGKPLDIKFTAVDGTAVDVSTMKGKVVLIDFWATWCGPCMAELPNVKAAYAKLHDKGFEIVGISFDQDKDKLQKTLKEKGMTWVQFFDGEGWGNKYGKQYGIQSIPTMWLVNKKGVLCDVEARDGLEEKITKLLAE